MRTKRRRARIASATGITALRDAFKDLLEIMVSLGVSNEEEIRRARRSSAELEEMLTLNVQPDEEFLDYLDYVAYFCESMAESLRVASKESHRTRG